MQKTTNVGMVNFLLFVMNALKLNIDMPTKQELENKLHDLQNELSKIELDIHNADMANSFVKQQQMVGKYYKCSLIDSNPKVIDYYYVYEWSTSNYSLLSLQITHTKYEWGWYASIKTMLGASLRDSVYPNIKTEEISKEEFIKSYNDAQSHLSKLI